MEDVVLAESLQDTDTPGAPFSLENMQVTRQGRQAQIFHDCKYCEMVIFI